MNVSKAIILMIEDNEKLSALNCRAFESEGYRVLAVSTLKAAREHLSQTEPDVILLDIMLPDGDGLIFCDEIREQTKAHIILLTAKREHETLLQGFSIGCDDFVRKPFKLDELLSRVASAVRRKRMYTLTEQFITKGRLTINTIAMECTIDGVSIKLTPKEYALLLLFVKNEDNIMNADYLYESVWGAPLINSKTALKIAVSKLRRKLEPTGYTINAVRDKGYVFLQS